MILPTMLLRVFGSRIILSLVGATLLLAMSDLAETTRQLADHEEPLKLILIIYGNLSPSLALQALPLAILFGVLLAIADLENNGELLALRSLGVGSFRLAVPPIIIAAFLGTGGIIVADHIAPSGVARAVRIQMEDLGRMRNAWSPFHREHRWFASEGGGIYHVSEVHDEGIRLAGLWRYDHDEGRIRSIEYVDNLWHDGEKWLSGEAVVWELDKNDFNSVIIHGNYSDIESPVHFAGVGAHPEALTRASLKEAIRLTSEQGRNSVPFKLEAQARWTMPLMGLALAIFALGLGLARPPSNAVEASGTAIGIAFLAWTLLAVCRAMGLAGMLAPAPAAFLPVAFPGITGLFLLIRWK